MNNKTLIFAALFALLSAAFALSVISSRKPRQHIETEELLFSKTYDQALNVNKILITDSASEKTLLLNGKYWRIPQADNYYAGLLISNALLYSINTAKIETIIHNITPDMQLERPRPGVDIPGGNGTEIRTYDKQGRLIDDVIIGSAKNGLQYAKRPESDYAMMVSGGFDLPRKLYDWLQQPLLQITQEGIETIILQSDIGQQMAFKPQESDSFYNVRREKTDLSPLLTPFTNLKLIDVVDYEVSEFKNADPDRVIAIFMFSGLIYGIELYRKDTEFWIRINLSSNTLPTKLASDYIKDSSFLYHGWIFKIHPEAGARLLNYNIR